MTIDSMNVVNNLLTQNTSDKKTIEDSVDTNTSIKFKDTFKNLIDEKIGKYNKKADNEEKDLNSDEDIDEIISLEMIKYNIKPEIKEETLDLSINTSLEEDLLVDLEASKLRAIDEDLLLLDSEDKFGGFVSKFEEEIIVSSEYLEDEDGLNKLNKNNEEKILNKEYNQPIEDKEEKLGQDEVNKNFGEVLKNSGEESDIQRVGEDKELGLEDMDKIINKDLNRLKNKIIVKNEEMKEVDLERDKTINNENIHIQRTIPKIDSQIISEDNIHQFQKENIEIVSNTIIKLMETTQEGDSNIMKVKLYPKELGNIDVLLTMNESKLEIKIMVQNQNIKDMFGENIEKLNQNLAKQNINLSEFSVDVNQEFNLGQGREREEARNKHIRKTGKMMSNSIDSESFNKTRTITSSGGISILA